MPSQADLPVFIELLTEFSVNKSRSLSPSRDAAEHGRRRRRWVLAGGALAPARARPTITLAEVPEHTAAGNPPVAAEEHDLDASEAGLAARPARLPALALEGGSASTDDPLATLGLDMPDAGGLAALAGAGGQRGP